MDVSDDMTEIHRKVEYELSALDAELEGIDDLSNIDQLELLIKEYIIINRYQVQLADTWYADRIHFIETYKELNWDYMIQRFASKNTFLCNTSIQIVTNMNTLLAQYQTGRFSLELYEYVIYNIHNVWHHYKTDYLDKKPEYDVDDLIGDMTWL
jgi:hypothetical protein